MFAAMSALVRFCGETAPVGQVVFFRAAFAIVPVADHLCLARRADRRRSAPSARSAMSAAACSASAACSSNFAALARLPLVDATAISFASPLITVALAAIVPRRSACASIAGRRWSSALSACIVMLWPHLDLVALRRRRGRGGGDASARCCALLARSSMPAP